MRILDIMHLEKRPDAYAMFGDDGHMYIARHGQQLVSIAYLPSIIKTRRVFVPMITVDGETRIH